MPNYNYLPNNKSEFPHISNVDTFKYDNAIDYARFDVTQMRLQICSVPWDVGEAHVGARTISGIGNVVYFETKEKRDAWFDAIPDDECYRFETKYKELHREQYIDVPIPFDMCAKHNYLVVSYSLFANDDSPLQYEGDDGVRKWFWFIRDVEFLAPNTTRLHLLDDAFQTWIYDINITGMILERGHAPMFATRADEYLANPIDNNEYLLTEDVSFGDATQVKHVDAVALNAGTMYACIASTASAFLDWSNICPAASYYEVQGVPSVFVFAVPVGNLNTFLANVTASIPQFKQTVQGIFFASSQLVSVGSSFVFAGVTCYSVFASRTTISFINLSKADFAYDSRYADIAKLYTMPYAHIEVTDENGNADIIRIEDTNGTVDISAAMNIAFPFVSIDAHLLGVGGRAGATVTFKNIDSRTFNIGGQWYDTIRSWTVPTFAVVLDAATEYDYSTRFDRAQRVVDYQTAYANDTARNATELSNQNANADLTTNNSTLTTTANSAMTSISNGSASYSLDNTRDYNFGVMDADNAVIADTATSEIEAANEQAAIATASAAATGVVGAIASAVTGDVAGAVSSAVNGIIGGASTLANTAVSTGLTAAKADIAQNSNIQHSELATQRTANDIGNQQAAANSMANTQNTLTSGMAANSAATTKANAQRTYNTGNANAGRTQSQAQSAIANDIAQAGLRTPFLYGSFGNGDSATTKPMALFAHVVTQSKAAIKSAGDEFLRYGYRLDEQWDFDGNWNIGKYFTYWKLRDFWVSDLSVADLYMDKIRFFLFGGVTIWRAPEYIGKVSVYDNYNG